MMPATILHGGPIRTMDPRTDGSARAVVVEGDGIVAVGGDELPARYPDAARVDLAGRTLVPGFVDAHNHLSIAALQPCFGDARAVSTPDDLDAVLRAHAAERPDDTWLRLDGWDDTRWPFAVDRTHLDAVERPVVLVHTTLHQCVVNSAALAALGIGTSTPDPPGGEIARDPRGAPTGLLRERAWSEAHAASLAPYADPDRWAEHIAARARLLLRDGITAVHDAACSPEAEAVYRAMAAAGTLPISVLALPHPAAILSNDAGDRLDGPPTGEGDAWCRVGPAKLFADGGVAIALDTAIGGAPVRMGILMADLEERALAAAARGFRLAVHAIGNRGVAHALDTLEAVARRAGDGDHRFRIEHALVTGPGEWARMASLGVIGVVQPGFVEHVGIQSGGVAFDDDHWLAFAALAEAGVRLAGSSDDPCAPVPPLWAMGLGTSRTTSTGIRFEPEQSLPFDDWLRAYTVDAAYAGGQEDERGAIRPGLRADFAVLDLDGSAPRVAATIVAGDVVYDADARSADSKNAAVGRDAVAAVVTRAGGAAARNVGAPDSQQPDQPASPDAAPSASLGARPGTHDADPTSGAAAGTGGAARPPGDRPTDTERRAAAWREAGAQSEGAPS